ELAQLVHHKFAYLARGYLAFAQSEDLVDDPLNRRVDVLGGHRPLVECALESDANPALVEVRTRAVAFHDLRQSEFHRLVGREALLTGHAAATAANRVARVGH